MQDKKGEKKVGSSPGLLVLEGLKQCTCEFMVTGGKGGREW